MLEQEKKDAPNQMKYSIWDTRIKEDAEVAKEKILEATERSNQEGNQA